MNSDFSYLASKCLNLTSKNRLKSRTCPSVSLSVHYLMQSHNWIDLGHFFQFFCNFLATHIKKRLTTYKIILTPSTKEPIICHALATTSAFNLKLCHRGDTEYHNQYDRGTNSFFVFRWRRQRGWYQLLFLLFFWGGGASRVELV